MRRFLLLFAALILGVFCVGFGICFYYQKQSHALVSVVMPTYNREGLLPLSIESILNQTYRNFEFIIVDDGSTDGSVALIKEYQAIDPRIILIQNNRNRGIAYSRNRGHDIARGKYVMVMDSDDMSYPTRMEKQVRFLEENLDLSLVICFRDSTDERLAFHYNGSRRNYEPLVLNGHYLGHVEWMMRRSFFVKNNIRYSEKTVGADDYDILVSFLIKRGKIGYMDEPLVLHRTHRSNPPAFYQGQKDDVFKARERLWSAYGLSKAVTDGIQKKDCDAFRFVARINEEKQILNQNLLESFINDGCRLGPPVRKSVQKKSIIQAR